MGSGSSKISKGGGGGAGSGASRNDLIKKIDSTAFKKEGGGVYSIDVPGVGGAQIIDETGSARALRAGYMPGAKAYAISVWDKNYNISGVSGWRNSLNDAKSYAKTLMRGLSF